MGKDEFSCTNQQTAKNIDTEWQQRLEIKQYCDQYYKAGFLTNHKTIKFPEKSGHAQWRL